MTTTALARRVRGCALALALALLASCAGGRPALTTGWVLLPQVAAAADLSEEQRSTLARQGPPTARWRTRLATERWVYCQGTRVLRVLEFDSQGGFLSEAYGGRPELCDRLGAGAG